MSTSYYSCTGTVSNSFFDSTAKKCSTGWQTYNPPVTQNVELSGELLTAADTTALLAAIMLLVALWAAFKIILNTMGIKL